MFRTGSVLILLASCQQTCMTYTTAVCTVKKTPDDGQRNCPKHAEFYCKNKFEILVHLKRSSTAITGLDRPRGLLGS